MEKNLSCVPLIPNAVRNLHTRVIADERQPDDHPCFHAVRHSEENTHRTPSNHQVPINVKAICLVAKPRLSKNIEE